MRTTDFSFDLPSELIAQHPPAERGQSRLLVLDRATRTLAHEAVARLPAILRSLFPAGVVMVFNNSRVRKARLYAVPVREHGAGSREKEFLLTERVSDTAHALWRAVTPGARRLKPGARYLFPGSHGATVRSVESGIVLLEFDRELSEEFFTEYGHVPLPPYISRPDASDDERRYQTVYADRPGSVAAPTAGLHFSDELLRSLAEYAGIEWVTLHVGIGTFLPVRTGEVADHVMHSEECELTAVAADRLNEARASGRKLLAVGTTTVRTLESAWNPEIGRLAAFKGSTSLFVTPGYRFQAIDALFTNFHTPESTLLMLVCAFGGTDAVLDAYRTAVAERYRFFSYGDAMLIA